MSQLGGFRIRWFAALMSIAARWISARTRRLWLRALNDGLEVSNTAVLHRGVSIRSTDNGRIKIGGGCDILQNAHLFAKSGLLEIGEGVQVGIGTVLCARNRISIGRRTLIAEYVTIRDQDHKFGRNLDLRTSGFTSSPVSIGENVWIGAHSVITAGCEVGSNSVIGAGAIVTRSIPPNAVAVGAPARVIRTF